MDTSFQGPRCLRQPAPVSIFWRAQFITFLMEVDSMTFLNPVRMHKTHFRSSWHCDIFLSKVCEIYFYIKSCMISTAYILHSPGLDFQRTFYEIYLHLCVSALLECLTFIFVHRSIVILRRLFSRASGYSMYLFSEIPKKYNKRESICSEYM